MPFETLLQTISHAHGHTNFTDGNGRAFYISQTTTTTRNRYFTIYNNASYGSRTTPNPPNARGSQFTRLSLPDIITHPRAVTFRETISLVLERRPPATYYKYKTVKDRTNRYSLFQVCPTALYILFDITKANDAENVLKAIYESLVLRLDEPAGSEVRVFREETPPPVRDTLRAEAPAASVNRNPRRFTSRSQAEPLIEVPPEPKGKGVRWDYCSGKKDFPEIPLQSQPESLIKHASLTKQDHSKKKIQNLQDSVVRNQREYDRCLRRLKEAQDALVDSEQELLLLKQSLTSSNVHNDVDVAALTAVLDNWYEKVWSVNDSFWALSRPVVMRHSPDVTGEQDPCQVKAGKFLVEVSKGAEVKFWRADGRIAREDPTETGIGGKGWCVSPHYLLDSQTADYGHICWGNHQSMLRAAQREFDYTQIFLLTIQHIAYVNPHESYITLRGYAKSLDLEITEDPLINQFVVEMNENAPSPESLVQEVELTEDELRRWGIVSDTPSVNHTTVLHPDHLSEEMMGDDGALEGR